jgi:short-subunit dehydrogenase
MVLQGADSRANGRRHRRRTGIGAGRRSRAREGGGWASPAGTVQAVASEAREIGVPAKCHCADLSIANGQIDLIRQFEQDLPQVDFLIQSAAARSMGPIEEGNLGELDALYHTNVRAPYVLAQSLLPKLKDRHGQIVFINSSSGVAAKPMFAQYDATKHALKAIADSLRGEVNPHGVRVLSVYLGRTATEMQAQIHKKQGKPFRPELLLQPTDVASVIMNALLLPPTAEVTDVHIRPMIKT